MMNLIDIRRTKILRDLWNNRTRTLLIVLSIAVGVAAFGLMNTGRIVLQQSLSSEFAASNPAHSVLVVSPFGQTLIDKLKALPVVERVEARHFTQANLETTPNHWISLELHGFANLDSNFSTVTINRIKPQNNTLATAPASSIYLERSIADLYSVGVGQKIRVRTLDNHIHELTVAGFVNDLSRQPTSISLIAYGYTSLDTLDALGEPIKETVKDTPYNRLYVVLKGSPTDRVAIERGITTVTAAVEEAGSQVYSAPIPEPGKQIMSDSMNSVLIILGVLGALTLALSAFLVINIMSAVIAQQIPQIGILKSLGGRSSQLMQLYFELVLWFGIMGFVLAVPMGIFGSYFLVQGLSSAMNFDVPIFYLPTQTLILQIFGAIIVPLIAAASPILMGSRITIRDAISGSNASESSAFTSRWLGLFPNISQLFRVSVGNTFRRKARVILTLAALSLAGAMFIALLGIRESMRQAVADIQASLNYDVSLNFDRPYPAVQVEATALKVPGVIRAESWGVADGRRKYDDRHLSSSISLIAVPPETKLSRPTVTQGRWLQKEDQNEGQYVLFANVDMMELAPDMEVGKEIKLKIGNDERLWKIVGVSARSFTPIAYIPYNAFEAVTDAKDQASVLAVQTNNSSDEAQSSVQAALLKQFESVGIRVVNSDTTTALKQSSASSLDILVILLMVMVVLIAVVGGLGLAITMGLNVMERTREIGILRSLGATNGIVRQMVIVEGIVIGVVSWLIGAICSVPLGIWLGNALGVSLLARPLDYGFSVSAFVLWLLLVIVIAIVASLIPAQRAAQLTIRDTLAYVG